jgi:hypothetical protein
VIRMNTTTTNQKAGLVISRTLFLIKWRHDTLIAAPPYKNIRLVYGKNRYALIVY